MSILSSQSPQWSKPKAAANRKMASIGIVGLGNWGTALAKVWGETGHNITGWTIEEEVYASITEKGINEKYLPGEELHNVNATMDLEALCEESEILILSLPSGVVLNVVDDLLPYLRPSHALLDLAKGLAPDSEDEAFISAAIEKRLRDSGKANPVFVMTGPTIAPEVARGVLTTALIAAHDHTMAKRMADRLTTKTLSLQAADDPLGAELWGAFKNPIALACGIVDGLGSRGGDNLKAALVTAGFREGQRLLPAMGASPKTAFTAAGLGDLYVTSTSPSSRNRTLGEMLGSGLSLEEALGKMHMVAEGVRAARMFLSRAAIQGIPTPFLHAICDFLDGGISVDEALSRMIEIEI